MKIVAVSLLSFLILNFNVLLAQKTSNKEGNAFSLTANIGASSFANSLAWTHVYGIGKNKRFKVGYGLRLTNLFGSDQNFTTAPAKFTSGKSSIAALFSENIIANIDTIGLGKVQTNFINAGIYLNYTLPYWKNRLELGVNIDAIGFTFGSKQNASYNNNTVSAKPSSFNILLISDSDVGSLNSEWYISYWASKNLKIKAGYEFLFTEYTTETKIQAIPGTTDRNDRFRLKSPMVMFGIVYAPFKK